MSLVHRLDFFFTGQLVSELKGGTELIATQVAVPRA